jgi:hypothetical protein
VPGQKGFGNIAKKWLKAQADELLTTDHGKRENASATGDEAERDARDKVAEEAIYTAVPGLRTAMTTAETNRQQHQAEQDATADAELRARQMAGVGLSVTGMVTGSWAGNLPCRIERIPDTSDLKVDLTPLPESIPMIGGEPLLAWTFIVLDFTGPKTYDLAAAWQAREAAGASLPEPWEWMFAIGNTDEAPCWYDGAGASTIEVLGDDCRHVKLHLAHAGPGGDVDVTAELNLPELPASVRP